MTYELWDKQTSINGVEAQHFLERTPFKDYTGDIILIKNENDVITSVECKDILANVHNIDASLGLSDFMAEYFSILEAESTLEGVDLP